MPRGDVPQQPFSCLSAPFIRWVRAVNKTVKSVTTMPLIELLCPVVVATAGRKTPGTRSVHLGQYYRKSRERHVSRAVISAAKINPVDKEISVERTGRDVVSDRN